MIWEIISSVATATSVIIAVVTFLIDIHNKKRSATIQAVDQVFDAYYQYVKGKDPNKDGYNDYIAFLSIVDRLAIDANENVLSRKITKSRLSILIISEYDKHMHFIIKQRRKQFKRDTYYKEIDKLVDYLKNH